MRLSELIEGVPVVKMFQTVYGSMIQTHDVEIQDVRYDSRTVTRDDLFVAIRGVKSDGHRYLHDVIHKKAKAVVVEDDAAVPDSLCMHEGVVKIVVSDSRKALSRVSANYFRHPSKDLRVIGVTGTNGKTTTTYLIASIIKAAGMKPGLIGTIEYRVGDETYDAHHTTPESYELQKLLRKMVDAGCSYVVMEVSSHALEQRRVDDVKFSTALFTNLTQDHLDYHKTMEEYFRAKKRLFQLLDDSSIAISNFDSEYGLRILDGTSAKIISYGVNDNPDIRADAIQATVHSTSFSVYYGDESTELSSPLIGRFNVSNILAAFACGYAEKFDTGMIKNGIARLAGVRGRFEKVAAPPGTGWIAVVDYSHTPDALENVLRAIQEIKAKDGKVTTVFGCGGDRDRSKRPVMGTIANRLSDLVIVTSDNPRSEDPESIIDEILNGIEKPHKVVREADRRRAIEQALRGAQRDDVVLIAGKGHETYQIIGDNKIHFNDKEVVEEWIKTHLVN